MTKRKANPQPRTSKKKTGKAEPKARALKRTTIVRADKPEDQTPATPPANVTDLNSKREARKPSAIKAEASTPVDADPVGEPVGLALTAAQLSAAVMCSAKAKEPRHYLIGVYLHVVDGALRLVSTDGHRLLAQTIVNVPEDCPLGEDGVILSRADVEQVLKFTGKDHETTVWLEMAQNDPRVTLRSGFGTFTVRPVDAKFPEYRDILARAGETFTAEREPLDAAAIKADYMKAAGIIATQLGASAVFPYQASQDQAVVFTFAKVEGAVFIQMPLRSDGEVGIAGSTAALIGASGLASTVTALRAHETRNRKAAKGTTDEALQAKLTAKADEFKRRIDAILAGTEKALPAPKNGKAAS